jgi:uncharacterized membrane protein YcfT
MTTAELLNLIEDSAIAHAISKTHHLVAAGLQVVHIAGFMLLLAAVVFVNLRLLGWAFAAQPVQAVSAAARRWLWGGLALAAVSGVLMFVATPTLYAYKGVFQLKLLLLAMAVLFQVLVLRHVVAAGGISAPVSRSTVVVSLLVWFGTGAAGRAIGFV